VLVPLLAVYRQFGVELSRCFLGFTHHLGWKWHKNNGRRFSKHLFAVALYLSRALVLNKEVAPSFWRTTANCAPLV